MTKETPTVKATPMCHPECLGYYGKPCDTHGEPKEDSQPSLDLDDILGDFSEALRLAEVGFDSARKIEPSFEETKQAIKLLFQSRLESLREELKENLPPRFVSQISFAIDHAIDKAKGSQ